MKILVLCQYYYPEPFRISDICESLVELGHEVTVLTGLPNYPEGKILRDYKNGRKRKEVHNGVSILRCFEIGRGKNNLSLFMNYISFMLSASLKTVSLKDEFDIVFVNQLSPILMSIPAIIYKKMHQTKILLYCLDLWPASLAAKGIKEKSIIYKMFTHISKWIYKSADTILVTSSMFKDYFRENLDITSCDIIHLPQYAEDLFLNSIKGVVNEELITCKKGSYNFVFAGNIGDVQSVETIIKAANELQNKDNIVFHIIGDGSNFEHCKNLSAKLKLDNIVFYGRRPLTAMPYFYNMADALLVTMINDKILSFTLPGKVQSYMAAGKPIIGAINGETKRVIDNAKCGFCCSAEDYLSFSELILNFININNKEKFSHNATDYYNNNFKKEIFFSVFENILLEMINLNRL